MSVEIQDDQDVPIDKRRLKKRLAAALRKAGLPDSEVSVLLTDDERMTELNRTYRSLDKTTDVLSFPLAEEEDSPLAAFLGDIVISVPTAQRQARESKVTLVEEVENLALHGLLHLLGRDHESEGWESWRAALAEITPDE
ncbi:MAG: rRNA maturation RNase YbeY [Candidatus Omnitrophica bacterium]|nr:Endoribonuclease YbeY [bacterium]NUN98886.1 rRNA maturation RNase YbeY [Candidatus Omnitrophota bacterium]